MKNILVPPPKNESVLVQLSSLYKTFENVSPSEAVTFDLSKLKWVCPILVLPVSAYIADTKSNFKIDEAENRIKWYFDVIKFPEGISSKASFDHQVKKNKNYIPISVLKKDAGEKRERLESSFQMMVYKILGSVKNAQNAVYHPISELVTNIFEHSKDDKGFVFAQFYPKKEYLDVCIIDRGRGFSGSYQQEKGLRLSDEKAIGEVMKGNSVKDDKERGYGVRTSKRLVCEGLNGEFLLISGSAAFFAKKNTEKLISLPRFSWKGVIVSYRMHVPAGPVDIYPYME